MIGIDDRANMDAQFVGWRHVLGHQSPEALDDIAHVAVKQRQHQAVFVAEIIFHQRAVQASTQRKFGQRQINRVTIAHDLACSFNQLIARSAAVG